MASTIKSVKRRLAEMEMGIIEEAPGALFFVFDRIVRGYGKYYTAAELIELYGRPAGRCHVPKVKFSLS